MHIVINRKSLLKELQIADIAISNDKVNYVKSAMVIETVSDDTIVFKTNGDGINIISPIKCQVKEKGMVNIKPDLIEEFLHQIDDEEIEIKVNNTSLSIVTKSKIDTNFSILEPIEANIPKIDMDIEYIFNKNEFLSKLERVRFAASNQADLEHLNCVRMEIEEGKLKLVSTDSFRLIYLEENYKTKNKENTLKVNIPTKTIDSLMKVIKLTDSEEIVIKSEGVRIEFKIGDVIIYSKLIELQFPAYKPLFIALENPKEILIDTTVFTNLLKRLQIFERQAPDTNVIFNISKNLVTATIDNSIVKFKEEVNVVYDDTEEIRVSLSVKFLLGYLNAVKTSGIITLRMDKTDRKPVAIITKSEEKYYYFVMPTRI